MSRQAWDRLPDETGKAWAAFELFRRMPTADRSMAAVARAVYGPRGVMSNGMVVGRIRAWATQNEWEARVAAWDQHLAAEKNAAWVQAAADMGVRHAQEAQVFEAALLVPARELLERLADPSRADAVKQAMAKLPADQLLRLIDRVGRGHALIGRFERLSRGLSEGRTEVTGKDGGPIVMSTEEAKAMLAPILGVDEDAVVDELGRRRREQRRREREEHAQEG